MRAEKQLLLDEIKENIDSSTAMIIASYDRLPPNLSWDLRDQLMKSGSAFEVVRKRVFLKAAELSGLKLEEELLKGHIGVVFVKQPDALSSAKTFVKFSEEHQNFMEVLWGQIDGKTYQGSEVVELAKLPGINDMRSELIGLFVSPMSHMLSVLEAVMSEQGAAQEEQSKE